MRHKHNQNKIQATALNLLDGRNYCAISVILPPLSVQPQTTNLP